MVECAIAVLPGRDLPRSIAFYTGTLEFKMKFEDLDGNVLWLGTEPRKGEPFES